MTISLIRPIRLPPALKGTQKTLQPIIDLFRKGLILDSPDIIAERLADGRIRLKLR